MNCYLIITNKKDYLIDINNNFKLAGFPIRHKSSITKMKKGDKIIFYVTKESRFCSIVEVCGEYFESDEQIWGDSLDNYESRIHTKPVYIVDNYKNGVYIKDIWDDLEFIDKKKKWGSQVMGSFRRLSKHDFDVIYKAIKNKKNEKNIKK